ncbi:substrate-binding periplasmic protein [Actinorugispora endophytica]|uniref:Polar amino acid transport system substrate-binding protein n=1 Tax=Actinorugispora endophytica TaxID=1605990 RepID=A0A4V3D8F7_9ACTN|nr:transporter substrate-binding domain-containing protein [Actinorugispora endophytica]TDQ51557.1 polar amino acid transport system substrate-binding protein [Actinorugispora endophytica]
MTRAPGPHVAPFRHESGAQAWARVIVVTLLLLATFAEFAARNPWPDDSEGTLDRVRGGVLRVGVTGSPPWTRVADDGSVSGVEPVLVRRLAEELDARVRWSSGSESDLMASLHAGGLDLVAGGLGDTGTWQGMAALTTPYTTTRAVVGVPAPMAGEEVSGTRVAVRADTAEEARLREEGGIAVPYTGPAPPPGEPAVVGEWMLGPLGLRDSGVELSRSDHVMAVRMGENAWLATVEGYLLDVPDEELRRLLVEAEGAGR